MRPTSRVLRLEISLRNDLAGELPLLLADFNDAVASCEATFSQPFCFYVAPWGHSGAVDNDVDFLLSNLKVYTSRLLGSAAEDGAVE